MLRKGVILLFLGSNCCHGLFHTCASIAKSHQSRVSSRVAALKDDVDVDVLSSSSRVESHVNEGSEQGMYKWGFVSTGSKWNGLDTPEVVAIMSIYFVQGALGLARLATTFFLKDELHLGPAEAASIMSLSMLPWVVKPLYGFLTDSVPIFNYKRRSYLVIAGVLGSLSWLAMGTVVSNPATATLATVLGSAGVAISDVVADSIVVEKSRPPTSAADQESSSLGSATEEVIEGVAEVSAGDLQSLCWASAAIGGILTAYLSGSLLEVMPPRIVFDVTSAFPLLVAGVSLLIREEPISTRSTQDSTLDQPSVKTQAKELWNIIRDPRIFLPVLFVFLWRSTPDAGSAMFYFSTNDLGFKPEFLGRVQLASSVASLAGVAVYRTLLKDVKIKDVILWTTLLSVPLGLTQVVLATHQNRLWGIPDELFSLTDSVVLSVLGQVAFMPTLVLAASLCPPGVEGTLFASLMSIYNFSGSVSTQLGAWLTQAFGITESNFTNLPMLLTVCVMSGLLPLPLIGLLDADDLKDQNIQV